MTLFTHCHCEDESKRHQRFALLQHLFTNIARVCMNNVMKLVSNAVTFSFFIRTAACLLRVSNKNQCSSPCSIMPLIASLTCMASDNHLHHRMCHPLKSRNFLTQECYCLVPKNWNCSLRWHTCPHTENNCRWFCIFIHTTFSTIRCRSCIICIMNID